MSNRTTLKSYFVTNAVPKQSDFSDLIDSGLNQSDDGIRKQGNDPVSIQAQPAAKDVQELLHFYKNFNDANAAWKLNLVNQGAINAAGGLNISNPASASNIFIKDDGSIGINTTPNFPLSFADKLGDKISLWGYPGSNYGFGIAPYTLQIHSDTASSDIAFGYGSSVALTETMRIKGNGNVGIGSSNPVNKLEVNGSIHSNGHPIYLRAGTSDHYDFIRWNSASDQVEITGYHGVNLGFSSDTAEGTTNKLTVAKAGVSIGTNTPYAALDVKGNVYTTVHGSDYLHDKSNVGITRFGMQSGNSGDGFAGMELETLSVNAGNGGAVKFMTWGYGIAVTREVMRINESGNVGIGTSAPQAKLHVSGALSTNIATYGYLNSAGSVGKSGGTFNVSIKASDRIVATEFDAYSDKRIKKDFLPLDSMQSLETINKVRVKKYLYKDEVEYGSNFHTGVIAQELEEVLPQSVSVHSDFVPDIYARPASASISNGELHVTMPAQHNLQTGDTVRLITASGVKENIVTKLNETNFSVSNWQEEATEIFVYGKKVNDYRTVNYNSIFCLGISAIQEMHKQLQQLKNEVMNLKEKLAAAFVPAL